MFKSIISTLLFTTSLLVSKVTAEKTKIVLLAGKDSHGANAHNWGEGVDLLSNALTEESGLNIETEIFKGGWPTDSSIFKNAASVVILSDGGGRHPINKSLKEFDALAEKGVGLVCVHYAVEVPKGAPGDMMKKWLGGYFEVFWSVNPHWTADFKTLPKHPITRGVNPFSLKDEWYYHMKFRDNMKGVTPILSALPPADTLKRGTVRTVIIHMCANLFWKEKKSNMLPGHLNGKMDNGASVSLGLIIINHGIMMILEPAC